MLTKTNRLIFAVTIIVALSGCAVGPKFKSPASPQVNNYTAKTLKNKEPRLVFGQNIPAAWWELFHSPKLDKLIRLALEDSPTLAAAQARLREAKENYNAAAGALVFPNADLNASATRQKITGASSGQAGQPATVYNLYNASVNVSYLLDIWGGSRKELESLAAQVDYQNFQQEAAYLALTSNIVAAVGEEIALRGQISAAGDILAAQEKQLELMEKQFTAGSVSRTETLAQKTLVEQTRTALLPMENELSRVRNQLCALVGKFPSDADSLPEFTFADLNMPADLPVSLPSELTRQRPDIRAQEALLHAASAKIGVATANMLPQITLTGSIGQQSNIFQDLFDKNNNIWSLGAGIAQPIFNAGSLKAKRKAAIAVYDQARSEYRQTVLLAFKNVADALKALEIDESMIKSQSDTLAAAQESLKIAEERFNAGAISYLILLDAQRQFHQARSGLVQAQAARFADTAALFQALGGGWWNRDPVKGEKSND